MASEIRQFLPARPRGLAARPWRSARFGPILFGVVATVSLPGCSVNDFGTGRSQVVRSGEALLRRSQAAGLHLDARYGNVSLTLGSFMLQTVHVAPCAASGGQKAGPPLMSFSRIVGVQIAAGRDEQAITLGLKERFRVYPPTGSEGGYRALRFEPDAPERMRLIQRPNPLCHDEKEPMNATSDRTIADPDDGAARL